jgi:hypothetical protein
VGTELIHADRQMDGRTDGRMGGRTDGRADGRTDGRTDRQTDITKLLGAFCNFVRTPENRVMAPGFVGTLVHVTITNLPGNWAFMDS